MTNTNLFRADFICVYVCLMLIYIGYRYGDKGNRYAWLYLLMPLGVLGLVILLALHTFLI